MALFTDSYLTDIVALIVAVSAIVFASFKWSFQYWKRKNVHYFEPSIPFGNMPNPFTSNISIQDKFKIIYEKAKAKGWKYCGVYTSMAPALVIVDLDIVKNIMTKDFNHFSDRIEYINEKDDPISCHLFALKGSKWKNLRAKLSPTFTSGKMKVMFQTMADCGVILEKYIQDCVADKEVVDIKETLARFSTDIIGSCAFGLDCNSFKEPNSPFRVYGKKTLQASSPLKLAKFWFSLNFPNAAHALGVTVFGREIGDFYTKVVNDTITYRRNNNITRNDFLQLLMEMMNKENGGGKDNGLTLNEIAAQSFVFFIAGFDTSSSTMTFALYELASHPEIQEKVREEIREVLGKHDNKITYDSMNDLAYMKQVIDETLRIYPPVAVLNRNCVQDYKIPGEDLVIEKGTSVFLPVSGYHNDAEYYKNAKAFDPDRFSAEQKKNRHHYAHLPFGEGPRICIGERFGIMQTKVGLTSILRNHRISLNSKTKVPLEFDPRTPLTAIKGSVYLNIEKV